MSRARLAMLAAVLVAAGCMADDGVDEQPALGPATQSIQPRPQEPQAGNETGDIPTASGQVDLPEGYELAVAGRAGFSGHDGARALRTVVAVGPTSANPRLIEYPLYQFENEVAAQDAALLVNPEQLVGTIELEGGGAFAFPAASDGPPGNSRCRHRVQRATGGVFRPQWGGHRPGPYRTLGREPSDRGPPSGDGADVEVVSSLGSGRERTETEQNETDVVVVHGMMHVLDPPAAVTSSAELLNMSQTVAEGNAHRVADDYLLTLPEDEQAVMRPLIFEPSGDRGISSAMQDLIEFPYDEGRLFMSEVASVASPRWLDPPGQQPVIARRLLALGS